jgi:hypothetical protein
MKTETHEEKNIHHRGAGNSSQPLLPYEALDYLPDLICVIGPDGFYEYFNKPWRQYASGNADQFVSTNWTECIYEADRCDVRREVGGGPAGRPKLKQKQIPPLLSASTFALPISMAESAGSCYGRTLSSTSGGRSASGSIF